MKTDKRQRVTLIITIAVFVFLGFEIYQLIHGATSSSPRADERATQHPAKPTHSVSLNPETNAPIYRTELPKQTQQRQALLATHSSQYINLVNQYEIARMERQVLEQQVAIAESRQRIAELNQKTAQIAGTNATFPSSNFSNATPAVSGSDDPFAYQLSYLDNQEDGYSATIAATNGHYYEVTPGYQLPGGVQVSEINENGVILEKNHHQFRLSFNGVTSIPFPTPEKTEVTKIIETAKKEVDHRTVANAAEANNAVNPIVLFPTDVVPSNNSIPFMSRTIAHPAAATQTIPTQTGEKKLVIHNQDTTMPSQPLDFVALPRIENHLFAPNRYCPISPIPKTVFKTDDLLPVSQPKTQPKNLPVKEKSHTTVNQKSKKIEPKKAVTRKKIIKSAPHEAYTVDEILLLELPPTSYTILLKSDTNQMALTKFAKNHALGENAIYFSREEHDHEQYILLYSYFNTRHEATFALQKLSEGLKLEHPRVESVSVIQTIIRTEKAKNKNPSTDKGHQSNKTLAPQIAGDYHPR